MWVVGTIASEFGNVVFGTATEPLKEFGMSLKISLPSWRYQNL